MGTGHGIPNDDHLCDAPVSYTHLDVYKRQTVDSVRIITDRETRRSKGFAFIEMPDSAEASNAINALNGAEYGGRPRVVKEALPKN